MSASWPSPDFEGYHSTELLYRGAKTIVYRALRHADNCPVILKLLHRDYPSFEDLLQFRNQYAITKSLHLPGVIASLDLLPYGNGYILVMEDFGGISLKDFTQGHPLTLEESLAIALQLADILESLHQHRIIHKDIKPANILINPSRQQVKLIDFSLASLLPVETQQIENLNLLEGTLAYLSPEQTGRMNRGIDYRTDFYSLGITLYELLTGQLPFTAKDPMAMVHCHLAEPPIPPHRHNPTIPSMLSDLVLKLMAKNSEHRYQSAAGLRYDLQQCQRQFHQQGRIAPFSLGQRDISDRFLIPERLYGREAEVQQLLAAFERIAGEETRRRGDGETRGSELLLIAGYSGIGKTAIVNEIHKPILRRRGNFIQGKFEQLQRNVPLSGFLQALRGLVGQLLSEPSDRLQQWRDRILAVVGNNGQVLLEVIPELERVIGPQPSVPDLEPTAAQNRFNLLFQGFMQIFARVDQPLVIFLDDLQWVDGASLTLLKQLLTSPESHHLLILGAYRDNEVEAGHPLLLTLADLQADQVPIQTLVLAPLSFADVDRWIADTLHCSPMTARPLSRLVYQKTRGNPFFTAQFLRALYADGWITFNQQRRYWQCDIAQVQTLALTDDVVELMVAQLQKLPAACQRLLQLAACIGNQFDLYHLAIAADRSQMEVATDLWPALRGGWVLPISKTYRFYQGYGADTYIPLPENSGSLAVPYRFLHDRVQQAAYALIPETEKSATHLQIGRLLWHHTPAD